MRFLAVDEDDLVELLKAQVRVGVKLEEVKSYPVLQRVKKIAACIHARHQDGIAEAIEIAMSEVVDRDEPVMTDTQTQWLGLAHGLRVALKKGPFGRGPAKESKEG